MARAPEDIRDGRNREREREPAEQIFAPQGAMKEVALARFLAGGRWRMMARWLGLGIFIFGALLLLWVFIQAFQGFQNLLRPNFLSSQFNNAVTVAGDGSLVQVQAAIVVFGTEFLKVLYLLLLGILASVIAGKGIQFFAASEAIIDEAVVGDVER